MPGSAALLSHAPSSGHRPLSGRPGAPPNGVHSSSQPQPLQNGHRLSVTNQSVYAGSSANPPPPPLNLGNGGPESRGPSVLSILAMGQERNNAADSMAHHPRIESLVKLGKESEATWLQIGATAESLGDLDRAIAAYESALRHNAYSLVALNQIAAICRSKEEFKKAAEYFGRVVGISPESGDVWGALGHCYLMIDDLKKAYSSYQQALYYMPNPQEPKLWYGIGILYDRYGSLEHAEEAFSSVIRMDPNFEKANEIFFRLGIIYKQQRKSQQSLDCFRYILHNPPRPLTEIDIWFQIGHVYEQQKDFLAAKESYERVLAENPAHAKVLQQLGGLYHRSRAPFYNPELSVSILTKSLESDATDPFSWYLLGRAYMTTSNFGKAYEAYQQAVYRDGKNPAFWCSIGVLYYNINQFHDALDAYSRAIRIHPYLGEVWFNLGALYESCNDQMTDAIDAYQRTLQLDPANTVVANRLREIREHQSTGAALSAPPTPKDISPSSLSWNYATNAAGAPAHLAQAGLGPELSPAMSRSPGSRGGPLSPPGAHRFDGPPAAIGVGRPRSAEPYRGADERRRASGGQVSHQSPPSSMDQSPRSLHRLSGPSQTLLPHIKALQDSRDAPNIPPPAEHRRNSPPSPRNRHADNATEHNFSPPRHYQGFQPSPYGRGDPPSAAESAERTGEMDWEKPRNGSGSARGGSISSQRRSPPGASHPREAYQHPPSHNPYDRHGPPPGSSRTPVFDDRDPRNGGPPQGYPPGPYAHGHYPAPPHSFDGPPRRYDPRDRERELAEEDERRRASVSASRGEASPRGRPFSPAEASGSGSGSGPGLPGVLKAKSAGKTKKDDVTGTPPPLASRKEAGSSSSKSRKVSDGSHKKDKKLSTPKEPAAKKSRSNGHGLASAVALASSAASKTPASGETSGSESSPTLTPAADAVPPPIPVPSRGVDEDYDEGVDALMGLAAASAAASASVSAPNSLSEQSAPEHSPASIVAALDPAMLPPLPTVTPPGDSETPAPDEVVAESARENDANGEAEAGKSDGAMTPNPRKRSLGSPADESGSKRSKSVLSGESTPATAMEVEDVAPVITITADAPVEESRADQVEVAEVEVEKPEEVAVAESSTGEEQVAPVVDGEVGTAEEGEVAEEPADAVTVEPEAVSSLP